MRSDADDLKSACLDLARTTKWSQRPIDAQLITSLAERFEAIALASVETVLDRDVTIIAKAVRYLNQVHAIPPMDNDTRWFREMLLVVLEIARPNTIVDERGKPFLEEMQKGISTSLSYEF